MQKIVAMERSKLFCSFSANATGIKFYDEWRQLHSMMRVVFRREYDNIYDINSILVLTYNGEKLGYLERSVAAALDVNIGPGELPHLPYDIASSMQFHNNLIHLLFKKTHIKKLADHLQLDKLQLNYFP